MTKRQQKLRQELEEYEQYLNIVGYSRTIEAHRHYVIEDLIKVQLKEFDCE